jgi:hypothetical protein
MLRKSKTEVLPLARPAAVANMRAILDTLVEEKVAEILSNGQDTLFQPYFQSKRVAAEIRKNQTVSEQRKWSRYFKKWGCDVCGTKKRGHCSLGRCQPCYIRTVHRLSAVARDANEKDSTPVFVDRLGNMAREALEMPTPLPPEKRLDLEGIAREAIRQTQKALPAGKKRRASPMLMA